jgi:tetratricopeptide (TPR) repeat protein
VEVARVLTARGDLARQTGELEQALELHTRALAIDQRALGEGHPAVARHHHNIAGILRRLARHDEALASYERARVLELVLGEEHPSVGLTENSIGLVLSELGRTAEARVRFDSAEAILRKANDPDRSHALVNLARLDAAEGKATEAIARLDEAIALLDASVGKAHPRSVDARAQSSGPPFRSRSPRRHAPRLLDRRGAGRTAARPPGGRTDLRNRSAYGYARRMAKVTGLGGMFIKTPDKAKTAEWVTNVVEVPTESWGRAFPWRDREAPDKKGSMVLGLHAIDSDPGA